MDIWRLKIFQKVIELKSFTKAAEAVFLSQPTISSHIKSLEEYFGCRLIDRIERKVTPTKAGELLYCYCVRMLSLFDETKSAISDFLGKKAGSLVVGGSTIPSSYIFPKIIGSFIQKYPNISISLLTGDTEKIIDDICSGIVEIGIVGARTIKKKIIQKELLEDDMCLIIPCDHKLAKYDCIDIESLLKEPFIIRETGSGTLKSIQNSLKQNDLSIESLKITAQFGSTESVIHGILNKVGVSILSIVAVEGLINAGALKALTIKGLDLKRKFFLTLHKEKSASPLCQAFLSHIYEFKTF